LCRVQHGKLRVVGGGRGILEDPPNEQTKRLEVTTPKTVKKEEKSLR